MSEERKKDGTNQVGPGSGSPFGGQTGGPGQPGTNKPQNVAPVASNSSSAEKGSPNDVGRISVSPFGGQAGGPGQTGTSNPQSVETEEPKSMTFEELQALVGEEATRTMVGGTGGVAGIPENMEAAKAEGFSPSDVLTTFRTGEFESLPLDEKVKTFIATNKRFMPAIANAQTIAATVAVVQGAMANTIKSEVCATQGGPKAWTIFRRANFDQHIHPNTLKVYMDIGAMKNVDKYLGLGVDRLGKLGAQINSSELDVDDPIKYILEKMDKSCSVHMPVEDFKVRCDAAILNYRLQGKGLDFQFETLIAFCDCGIKVEKVDIDEMLHRKGKKLNPVDYLLALMAGQEDRTTLLTHKKLAEDNKGKGKAKVKEVTARIKDLNSAVQELDETIVDALLLTNIETPLEEARIDRLIGHLTALIEKKRALDEAKKQAMANAVSTEQVINVDGTSDKAA